MLRTKAFGISLAMIMLLGSVPLGFSEPINTQVQQGIEFSELQCDNPNHVLVLRTNGNPACVTEKSAEKLGWELMGFSQPAVSEISQDADSSSYIKPIMEDVTVTLSHLPKVGETAQVTATFTHTSSVPSWDGLTKLIQISDNFEFVNPDLPVVASYGGLVIEQPLENLNRNDTATMTATIKAVSEGEGFIVGFALDGGVRIDVVVGINETLLLEDYRKSHPNFKLQAEIQDAVDGSTSEEMEEEEVSPTTEVVPFENSTESIFDGLTDEEIKEQLAEMGYTEEQIEVIIREIKERDNPSTQSNIGSIDAIFFTVYGKIINPPSTFDPSTTTAVHGLKICAVDKTVGTSTYTVLKNTFNQDACTITTRGGTYYIPNIPNIDPDNGGAEVDLYLKYYSNGNYVDIKNEWKQPYAAVHLVIIDLPPTTTLVRQNHNLNDFSIFNRAAWILDNLHDARDYFDDQDVGIDLVNVIWDENEKQTTVNNSPCPANTNGFKGACYTRSDSTLWLDGTTTGTIIPPPTGDEYYTWTQLHEYGHHIMRDQIGLVGWGQACVGEHSLHIENTAACAFSEGWADFVPHLIKNTEKFELITGVWLDIERDAIYEGDKGQTRDPDREWPTTDSNNNPIGHLVEGQVASMLWDLRDSNQDFYDYSKDNRSERSEYVINGMSDLRSVAASNHKLVMEDYYNEWNSNSLVSIADLHYMGFLNTAPDITAISDKTVDALHNRLLFTVTATDPEGSPITYSLTGNVPTGASIHSSSGVFRWTPSDSQVGNHNITVKASDGSLSSTLTFKVTVLDYVKPEIEITEPTGTHYYTENNWAKVQGTSSDNVDVTSISFELNKVDIGTITTNLDKWSIGPFSLSRSSNTFHAIAEDAAGNTETAELFILYDDPSHKSPPKTAKPTSSSVTSSSVTVSWVAPVSVPNIAEYDIFRAASPKVLIATVPSTQLSYTDNTVSASTTYQYTISATNQYGDGNESDALTVTTLEDKDITPPVINAPTDITKEATAILTPVSIGNATASDDVDPNPTITKNTTATSFPLGDTVIEWMAEDISNNNSTAIQTITITDDTLPIITAPTNYTVTIPNNKLVLPPMTFFHKLGVIIGNATASDIFLDMITNNSTGLFPKGDTIIQWSANDTSGNIATAYQTVTIEFEKFKFKFDWHKKLTPPTDDTLPKIIGTP